MQTTVPRDSPTYISRRRETKRIGPGDRPRRMPSGPLRIGEHDSEYTSLPPTHVHVPSDCWFQQPSYTNHTTN